MRYDKDDPYRRYDKDDPYRFPRVEDGDARRLFASLCSVSGPGNGDLMLNLLGRYFHENRVKFFVTSAVGFYVDPRTGKFDKDDPQNLAKTKPGLLYSSEHQIRGPLHPINIAEPILWLAENISAP